MAYAYSYAYLTVHKRMRIRMRICRRIHIFKIHGYARTHTWLENNNLKIEAKSVLTLQFVAYRLPSRCQPMTIVIDVNAHTQTTAEPVPIVCL